MTEGIGNAKNFLLPKVGGADKITHNMKPTWLDLMSVEKVSELGSGELRMLLDSEENGEDPIPVQQ